MKGKVIFLFDQTFAANNIKASSNFVLNEQKVAPPRKVIKAKIGTESGGAYRNQNITKQQETKVGHPPYVMIVFAAYFYGSPLWRRLRRGHLTSRRGDKLGLLCSVFFQGCLSLNTSMMLASSRPGTSDHLAFLC